MKQTLKNILITTIIMGVIIATMIALLYIGGSFQAAIVLITALGMLFVGIYYVVSHDDIEEKKDVCKTVWIAVDAFGDEYRFTKKPIRGKIIWFEDGEFGVDIPKGSIEAITGHKLTWEDEPLEITINEKK